MPPDDLTIDPLAGVTPPLAAGPSRFAPGAIVAGRYRLVALLGRGGMGEVYRADDLTLDQPVALKFLPEDVGGSDSRVAQFHNELRVARQVSHKNVCRLYDHGETDGRRFLTARICRRRCGASGGYRRTKQCRSRVSCAPESRPRTRRASCTAI